MEAKIKEIKNIISSANRKYIQGKIIDGDLSAEEIIAKWHYAILWKFEIVSGPENYRPVTQAGNGPENQYFNFASPVSPQIELNFVDAGEYQIRLHAFLERHETATKIKRNIDADGELVEREVEVLVSVTEELSTNPLTVVIEGDAEEWI